MRVINLLPWREAMYQRNRRHFILTLVGVTSLAVIVASVSHWNAKRDRMTYDSRLASLQARLSGLEQDVIVILQASEEIADLNNKLQLKRLERMQQWHWQQQMQVWQLLAKEARISAIAWSGEEVTLQAVSETADPVRKLIHNFTDWRLQQIELNAQLKYQFLVSSALKNEVSR